MTYLDNAATSFPKPGCVIRDLNICIKKYCGNPGRSSHDLSFKSAEAVYLTREKIADLLSIDTPESVVFTYNATYALNLAIKSLVPKNCHVLTTDFEHNSVIRPLERLKETRGIEYSSFGTEGDIESNIRSTIRDNTSAIVCSLASNVIGVEIELELISKIAREKGLILIIDASQAIGHQKIDLIKNPCDVFCAPGHKALFGIQGCGFAVFRNTKRNETLIEGGSGADSESLYMPMFLPEGYEAGTLSTPAIVSLGSGIDYINRVGTKEISDKLQILTEACCESLSKIKGLKIYKSGKGILSFNYKDVPSTNVASMLNEMGVYVRGGLHCAPSVHRKLGTLEQGAVRVSFSYLNSLSDAWHLCKAMKSIASFN